LDRWLVQVTHAPSPYEYEWGEIFSLIDARSDNAPEIVIRFKNEFPEGMDYKAYYQNRREQMERMEKQFENAKPLGQFPPGFSRKTK
jgi:hypothetical protein